MAGIAQKSRSRSVQEGLEGHFVNVFDVDAVLGYEMAEFFDFCRYLEIFGYKMDGFDGKLSTPEELVRRHIGNCWDQTELQREWFEKHGYEVWTYLLYYYVRDDFCPSHSILVFREGDGEWCWFEPMFNGMEVKVELDSGETAIRKTVEYSGIHKYRSERELLADFRRVFALNGQRTGKLPEVLEDGRWALYEYCRPEFGISDVEFYEHCRKGRKVGLEG